MVEERPQKPTRIYFYVIIAWIIFVSLVMGLGIVNDVYQARNDFREQSTLLLEKINQRVSINETVLEGFATAIRTLGNRTQKSVRDYARLMSQRYPQIAMFEVVDKVYSKDIDAYQKQVRNNINAKFTIKAFSYEGERKFYKPSDKEFYLPIVFMEPIPQESTEVLGLDLEPNNFFRESFLHSEKLNKTVASIPFKLIEGPLGYLLHTPADESCTNDNSKYVSSCHAMLVIYANSLVPEITENKAGLSLTLYNKIFSRENTKGHLFNYNGEKISKIETWLFPVLIDEREVASNIQKFTLYRQRQMGWSDVNWWLIIGVLIVGIVSFQVLMFYARQYHIAELAKMETNDNLFFMANHDMLTGLANKNLFDDRLEHAIAQAKRKDSKLAVFFMDLNDFKKINDDFGHELGDKILKRTSERLRVCVREEDTLARRSGDEFLLLVENMSNNEEIMPIVEKIRDAFSQAFVIDSVIFKVGISIGSAIYPQQGDDTESLMTAADYSMYEDKDRIKSKL